MVQSSKPRTWFCALEWALFQHISPRRSKEVWRRDGASQNGVGLLPQDLRSLLSELNFPLSGVVLQVLSIFLLLRITFLPVKSQVRTRKLWSSYIVASEKGFVWKLLRFPVCFTLWFSKLSLGLCALQMKIQKGNQTKYFRQKLMIQWVSS